MIRNYQQLAIVRQQLGLAEDALVSLHKRVYPLNARNYAVFAESYIDMILQLRAEIDAFLQIKPSEEPLPTDDGRNGGPLAAAPPPETAAH